MRYARKITSLIILTILMGVGFLFISTNQVRAQDSCELTIEKAAAPADDTTFNFSVTGDQNFDFTLSDPSDPTEIINIVVPENDNGDVGIVTVTEQLPPGWALDSIECIDGQIACQGGPCLRFTIDEVTNSITAECRDDDTGSCTFFNRSLTRPIPTLSHLGLLVLAGLFILVGIWAITRKKAAA